MEKKKSSPANLPGKPCFSWVGGKRRLLPVLIESLPKDFGQMDTYVEPFVGGYKASQLSQLFTLMPFILP